MDRSENASRSAAVAAVLERARALSPGELMRLAAAHRDMDPASRSRVLQVAVARAEARQHARRVAAEAAAAVQLAAGADAWRLRQLGVLWQAEMAVADAAVVALVGDHLSPEIADSLTAPWRMLG